jgi:hypothetical protein
MFGSSRGLPVSVLDASFLDSARGVAGRNGSCVAGLGRVFTGVTMAGAGMKIVSGGLVSPGGCFARASIGVVAGRVCQELLSRLRFLACTCDGAPAAMKFWMAGFNFSVTELILSCVGLAFAWR